MSRAPRKRSLNIGITELRRDLAGYLMGVELEGDELFVARNRRPVMVGISPQRYAELMDLETTVKQAKRRRG